MISPSVIAQSLSKIFVAFPSTLSYCDSSYDAEALTVSIVDPKATRTAVTRELHNLVQLLHLSKVLLCNYRQSTE